MTATLESLLLISFFAITIIPTISAAVHIHLIQFQVVDINGVPQDPSQHGWLDVLVAPPNGHMTVIARFKGYTGRYLFHCHNLEHEDLGMMADFEIIP